MAKILYFWHGFIHKCTAFMYLQYTSLSFLSRLPNIWKVSYIIRASIFVHVQYWPSYSTFFHFGEEIVITWSYIVVVRWMFQNLPLWKVEEVRDSSSGMTARYSHEEWLGFVASGAELFSWALDEGGAAGMCSSRQCLPSALEVRVVQYYTINVIRHNDIIFTANCSGRTFLGEENLDASNHLTGVISLVRMSEPRFRPYRRLVQESHQLPLVPIQQGLWDCIAMPFLHLGNFIGYSTRWKFAVN